MQRSLTVFAAAIIAFSGTAASFTPAQAGMMPRAAPPIVSEAAPSAGIVEIRSDRRWRKGKRGGGRHYSKRHRSGSHYSYRRHRGNDGAALAAGIFGFALGAVVAGQAHGGYDYHAVCARKYRSYDPYSRTYLGYDGYRHPCRLY